jgi:hypothetical protein
MFRALAKGFAAKRSRPNRASLLPPGYGPDRLHFAHVRKPLPHYAASAMRIGRDLVVALVPESLVRETGGKASHLTTCSRAGANAFYIGGFPMREHRSIKNATVRITSSITEKLDASARLLGLPE